MTLGLCKESRLRRSVRGGNHPQGYQQLLYPYSSPRLMQFAVVRGEHMSFPSRVTSRAGPINTRPSPPSEGSLFHKQKSTSWEDCSRRNDLTADGDCRWPPQPDITTSHIANSSGTFLFSNSNCGLHSTPRVLPSNSIDLCPCRNYNNCLHLKDIEVILLMPILTV